MDLTVGIATSTPWLVFAIVLMAISAVMIFIPRTPACIVAYMALWAARLSGYTPFSNSTMIYWGIAVALVALNRYMLPSHIRNSTRGLGYIGGGALAGMFIGLTMYRASTVIIGAAVGAFLGAVAYTRTSHGAVLEFPTSKFFNYLGAKGIPATMAASQLGLILAGLIARSLIY